MNPQPSPGQSARPPFTNAEVLDAFALVMPGEMAEAARRESNVAPGEPCAFWVSDSILLVLAAASDDLARRVAGFRPDLRERVSEVRRDPEAYIQAMRTEFGQPGGGPDSERGGDPEDPEAPGEDQEGVE